MEAWATVQQQPHSETVHAFQDSLNAQEEAVCPKAALALILAGGLPMVEHVHTHAMLGTRLRPIRLRRRARPESYQPLQRVFLMRALMRCRITRSAKTCFATRTGILRWVARVLGPATLGMQ
jgi:hypothetical protein